jgi:uroporphyrinogen decarboxylase
MITPRQRTLTSLAHQQPDRIPYHFEYTKPARAKLETYFNSQNLDDILDNHLVRYRASRQLRIGADIRPGFWQDDFGVVWNQTVDKDIGVVEEYPLKTRTLKGYQFPDAHAAYRFAALPSFIADHPHRFRFASLGFSLYERAWSLRGMEQLLVDMLEAPEFVGQLFDAIIEFDLGVIEELVKYDIDAVLFGDDWGQQNGLIFGTRLWRKFIKPRVTQLYSAVKSAGKAVFIHCCGKVQELFPDLIEAGVDVFNPFQPDVMDPYQMKKMYGDHLSFYGGVSVQSLLPLGTPGMIRDEVRRLVDAVGKNGGFVIAPSHSLTGDIPLENILAFIETVQAQ